jgi:hypothetical protein
MDPKKTPNHSHSIVAGGLPETSYTTRDAPLARLVSQRYEQARDALGHARDNTEAILAWDMDSIES